jgi:hypothetical protein
MKCLKKGISGILINIYLLFKTYQEDFETEKRKNILVVNMAISNIIILVFTIPFSTISALKHK